MDEQALYVGVLVSQDWLDVWVSGIEARWQIENDFKGIRVLESRLVEADPQLVVLREADGLENPSIVELVTAGLVVAVINAGQVQEFASATARSAKTCIADAGMLARIGEAIHPSVRELPKAQIKEVELLVVKRRELLGKLTAERKLLPGASKRMRRQIKTQLALLGRQVFKLDRRLVSSIRDYSSWLVQDIPLRRKAPSFTVRSVLPKVYGTTPRSNLRKKYDQPL